MNTKRYINYIRNVMALMAHMSNKQRPIKKPEAVLAKNVNLYIKIYLDEYLHTTSAKLSDIHNTHNAIQFVFDIAKCRMRNL